LASTWASRKDVADLNFDYSPSPDCGGECKLEGQAKNLSL